MAGLEDIVISVETAAEVLPAKALEIASRRAAEALARMRGPSHFVPYYGRGPADAGRPELQIRSGVHQAQLGYTVSARPQQVTVTFSGNIATQEFGATITHKRADKLAWPVGPWLDARGVRRYHGVREARRDWNTYALPTVIKGKLKGTKGPWGIVSIRRESVTIPPRPVIGPEVDVAADAIEADLHALLAEMV